MKKILLKLICTVCMTLTLSACLLKPFRFDIQQGNTIAFDKVVQIQPGMSEDQVRFILGSPTLQDIFHMQRWDYVYYLDPREGDIQKRHLAVFFQAGVVDHVTEDSMPHFAQADAKKTPEAAVS
jgi:outer membrane protein assembly factor BamE